VSFHRFARAALAVTALWLSATAAHATKIQRVVSPGGLVAWLVQDATVPLIAMEYAFAGGEAQDPPGKPGVANFAAGVLDEGAGDLDSRAFRERLDRGAISLSFDANGSLRTLKEKRDEAFDLTRLSLGQPRFDAEPMERVRAQIMSSLRRQSSNPNSIASRRFFEAAYGQHPYAWQASGSLESVPTITVDDIKAYVKRNLARDTLTISVVGDIDAATLGPLLDKTFGGLPQKADLVAVPDADVNTSADRVNVSLDVPQTVIVFGAGGIARSDKDFMTGYVLNHIMAGSGLTSRIYREVREKRGLVYSISESLVWMNSSTLLVGSTATRSDRAEETISTIKSEFKRMADDGPTQAELDEAKSNLKGSQMLSLDTSPKIASALLQYQIDKLGIDYIERRNGIIDAVTLDDAKRVAKKLWGQNFLTVAVGRFTTPTGASN